MNDPIPRPTPPDPPDPPADDAAALESARTLTLIVYGLQAAALVVGITFIAAAVVNYINRDSVRGTWLESHFRWQLRTFWFGLLWVFTGLVLSLVLIGYAVLLANMCWILYRVVFGWVRLTAGRPMYE